MVEVLSGRGGEGDFFHGVAVRASVHLLAGRGGEGEYGCSEFSLAQDRFCFLLRSSVLQQDFLVLSAGRGGEGEDDLCLLLMELRRGVLLSWCYEAATVLSSTLLRWHQLRQVHQRGTYAGVFRLAPVSSGRMAALVKLVSPWRRLSNLLDWRPLFSSSSTARVGCAPSGVVPGGSAGSRWRSLSHGGVDGPNCFSSRESRVLCAYSQDGL